LTNVFQWVIMRATEGSSW